MIVIPAAGRGTRFAPYTHFIPKELLPLLNKPALSYIIEECIHAQLTSFTVITHASKPLIGTFFAQQNLSHTLIQQPEPLGLGHAIACAQPAINTSYFGICLPDDIIIDGHAAIGQLKTISEQYHASVIAVQKVPVTELHRYGIISISECLAPGIFQLNGLIEKPLAHMAPSNYAIIGRYWLSREIFGCLATITPGILGEIQLTDALQELTQRGERVIAVEVSQPRYDLGTPQSWLAANNALASQLLNVHSTNSSIFPESRP